MSSGIIKEALKMQDDLVCPGCRDSTVSSNALTTYNSSGNSYKLYHCRKCDLQFWFPRRINPSSYRTSDVYDASVELHGLNIWHSPFFKNFPLRKGKLLDVGCNDGAFIVEAERKGFDVFGIDFDREAIKAVAKKANIKADSKSLDEFAKANEIEEGKNKFDVITFFQVLEHQDEPLQFLEQVRRLMNKNGWIAGAVPNRDRFIIKREYQDYPPNHFIYFSKDSLRYLLRKAGFSNIEIYDKGYKLADLSIYLEMQILGKVAEFIKMFLKRRLLKANVSQSKALSIDCLKQKSAMGYFILRMMKSLRNMLFILPALLLCPILKPHLYFQATINGEISKSKASE